MEGAGWRLGRASSRYGLPPTTTPTTKVLNGPVRKWKKKWVQVSPSNVTYQNSWSHCNGHINTSRLLLCRWTPISPTTSGDVEDISEDQPRRKFRYTPIVVLDQQKKEVDEKVNDEAKTIEAYQSTALATSKSDEKPGIAKVLMRDTQASNQVLIAPQNLCRSHFNLDLLFTANSDVHKSVEQIEDAQFGGGSSGRFGVMG